MSLPIQHLSDEAIAAFADGVLGSGARERAARHLAECAECATDVRSQREARAALRSAVAPSTPSALLERLRQLPITTPMSGTPGFPTVVIGDGGTPMFAAYGTVVPERPAPEPAPGGDASAPMSLNRPRRLFNGRSLALAGATSVLALGLVGGSVASWAGRGGPAEPAPAEMVRRGAVDDSSRSPGNDSLVQTSDSTHARPTSPLLIDPSDDAWPGTR